MLSQFATVKSAYAKLEVGFASSFSVNVYLTFGELEYAASLIVPPPESVTATVVVVATVSLSMVNEAYVARLQDVAAHADDPGAALVLPAASENLPAATVIVTIRPLSDVLAHVHVYVLASLPERVEGLSQFVFVMSESSKSVESSDKLKVNVIVVAAFSEPAVMD